MEQHDFEFISSALYVVTTKDICIIGGGLQVLTHMNDILEGVAQRFSEDQLNFGIWERTTSVSGIFTNELFVINMN